MKTRALLGSATALALLSGTAFAANPVTVNSAGGADFTSVQAAIASWAAGGANAGETAPFVINIDPTGTYDEQIILNSSVVGQGDIVGDIVIQSATPGTLVPIALQGEDGIVLHQEVHNVTLRDLLLYPSLTSTTTDELIKIDENGANATFNTITIEDCIITETDAAGVPLTTTRAGAYNVPTVDTGARTNGFASNIQYWGDNGESLQVVLNNVVCYGLPSGSGGNQLRANQVGSNGESLTVVDSVFAYGGTAATVRCGSSGTYVGTWDISGTDQTAGPDQATVILSSTALSWTFEGALAGTASGTEIPVSFSNVLLSGQNGIQAFGSATFWDISISDSIISCPTGIALETNANTPITISNVTFDSDEAVIVNAGASTVTVTDSIFAGADDAAGKFSGASTAALSVDFCALFTTLPTVDPASTLVPTIGSNIITGDPLFLSTDITSADFYDVDSNAYAGQGTASSDLGGGATFVGGTSVRDWMTF